MVLMKQRGSPNKNPPSPVMAPSRHMFPTSPPVTKLSYTPPAPKVPTTTVATSPPKTQQQTQPQYQSPLQMQSPPKIPSPRQIQSPQQQEDPKPIRNRLGVSSEMDLNDKHAQLKVALKGAISTLLGRVEILREAIQCSISLQKTILHCYIIRNMSKVNHASLIS